jgi:hypothetical protein
LKNQRLAFVAIKVQSPVDERQSLLLSEAVLNIHRSNSKREVKAFREAIYFTGRNDDSTSLV